MSELTPAASLAWRLAAAEAAGARHETIECGHFLIGILSLEKFTLGMPPGLDLPLDLLPAVRAENERVEAVLGGASLKATELRRALREKLGSGSYDHGDRPISRSPALRAAFRRAAGLAGEESADCLHFLAALLEPADTVVAHVLARTRSSAAELLERTQHALAPAPAAPSSEAASSSPGAVPAVVESAVRRAEEQHGIKLHIAPGAAAFLAEQAAASPEGSADPKASPEALVQAALQSMAALGKLQKSSAWQLVYEEGGLYLLPDS